MPWPRGLEAKLARGCQQLSGCIPYGLPWPRLPPHVCAKEGKQHRHSACTPAQSPTLPKCKINIATGLRTVLHNTATTGLIHALNITFQTILTLHYQLEEIFILSSHESLAVPCMNVMMPIYRNTTVLDVLGLSIFHFLT